MDWNQASYLLGKGKKAIVTEGILERRKDGSIKFQEPGKAAVILSKPGG